MVSVIEFNHRLINEYIKENDISIDMTIGNGNDTLVLVEKSKFVYGFDIQDEAINNTNKLLKGYTNYKLIKDSHLNFTNYINEEVGVVVFNLGYLPKGNKEIHTKADIVLDTLKKVLGKLRKDGICNLVLYPGHPSGLEEANLISDYLQTLNQKEFDVLKYEFINQINNPPFLISIKKRI